MEPEKIAKTLHGMMSAFRVGIGEPEYPSWEALDQDTIDLYYGAIDMIFRSRKGGEPVFPEDIHDYWQTWALKHRPGHNSLIPYKDLSVTEKIKDMLVISIIEILLYSENSVADTF